MNLNRLKILKQKLMGAKDLSEIWDYFFENFGMSPAFMRCGKLNKNKEINALIKEVLRQGLKSDVAEDITVKSIPQYHFFHGATMNTKKFEVITVLYYKDIDMGIFAILSIMTQRTSLARFSRLHIKTPNPFYIASSSSTLQ